MRPYLCDERLIDLVSLGKDAIEMVLILSQTQAETYQRTGHVIALNDEYVWRRIKAAATGLGFRQIGVRCIFCNATAPLGWWCDATYGNQSARPYEGYDALQSQIAKVAHYLATCDGPERSIKRIESLDAMLAHLKESARLPAIMEPHS